MEKHKLAAGCSERRDIKIDSRGRFFAVREGRSIGRATPPRRACAMLAG
jgi:hypothetical protein